MEGKESERQVRENVLSSSPFHSFTHISATCHLAVAVHKLKIIC